MEESVLLSALHQRSWWTDTSTINVQSCRRGWTSLMIAAELGDLKLVEHLLDAGADSRLVDWKGWTALIWAVARDRAAVCECFLAYNLPTQAEISAAVSVAIKLRSVRCLTVFLDRTSRLSASMAALAVRVRNAGALRALAKLGRVDYKTKEPGSSKSLQSLARQAGPSMYQALRDGIECHRLQSVGFAVSVVEGERRSYGVAKARPAALDIRIRSPLKTLTRFLTSKPAYDYSLEWTNEVRFDADEKEVQIHFPNVVVKILEAKVWLPLEVCRSAAYKHCGAMPFQERLEALMKSELLNEDEFLKQSGDLIMDLGTARDQMTVRQQEVNRRCALASSLGHDPSPAEADNWRRLQRQIEIFEHYLRTAKELRLQRRGQVRARNRTTPASTIDSSSLLTATIEPTADDDSIQYEKACVVCWSNQKSYLTMPCRHLCLCAACYHATKWKRCPVCNDPVNEIIRIFL